MASESTPKTTTARSPRKPADRKAPSQSDAMQDAENPPAGHDTLRSVHELRSGEAAELQSDILDLFTALGVDLENEGEFEIETTPEALRQLGKLGGILERVADDLPGFIEVDKGPGAQERITTLAMWYLGRLGESLGSAS